MSSKTRLLVFVVSAPVIVFAVVGGFLGKAMAQNNTYQHLRVFEDVVSLITNNYVEPVDLDKVMLGAMHGLADGLDPDSAFLTPDEVTSIEKDERVPAPNVGIELTRQYYLRVLAVRDGSQAAKAGLRSGDYIRAIDGAPTRNMSVWEGVRLLHGGAGSRVTVTIIRGNAAEPHEVPLTRELPTGRVVSGRMASPGLGYVRVAAFDRNTVAELKTQIADLTRTGVTKLAIDIRDSVGDLTIGLDAARLFVKGATLAVREGKAGEPQETIAAGASDGAVQVPVVLLVDAGTSGGAELFASALAGNKRAELVGEKTIGRAALQKLVKLPDGSGLWLSYARYLTPDAKPLHEKGLTPDLEVEQPEVEFGATPTPADPILDKAMERLRTH